MLAQFDVLISGAGPVGLYFAYLMSINGHSVYCVDPKAGPTNQSRALVITSRTMEILERRGFAGDILESSFISSGVRLYRKGTLMGQIDAAGDTPHAYMTILMQSKTEAIINKHLEEKAGCHVHWEKELVSYTQEEDKIISVIHDKRTGQKHTIESKYIIGADGSHSGVRKGNSAFTFDGIAIDTTFFLADIHITGDNIEKRMDKSSVFINSSGLMGMIPLNPCIKNDQSSAVRVFGNLDSYKRAENTENQPAHGLMQKKSAPSLDFIQSYIDESVAPLKFTAKDIIWSSFFKVNERLVNTYRNKRIFLIGDAAHCHSPTGGQGMNIGLHDADNLAWKLSYVLNENAINPDELLNSYEKERKYQAEKTLKATSNATKTSTSGGYLAAKFREVFLCGALLVPQVRDYFFRTAMQQYLSIDTEKSELLGTSDNGLTQPGQFLPDTNTVRLRKFENSGGILERMNIRGIMAKSNLFSVFFIGTCPPGSDPNTELIGEFWNQTRLYPVKRIVIESSWHTHYSYYPSFVLDDEKQESNESFFTEERIDNSLSLTTRIGLTSLFPKYTTGPIPSVLLFVRPDLYVAQSKVVYNQNDMDFALKYLDTLFNKKK